MRFSFFIILMFCFLVYGCSGAERDLLNRADAMMEENADSALLLLSRIDSEKLSGGDIPFYALLMTQAQVKADIPVASDSLIRIAYTRYVDDLRGDRGIRSNFYMGEVFFNQDKSRDAMKYYLTAYEESKRLGNDYWHAKAAERIADLFFNAYNYDEAAGYRKEAIEYYGLAGKTTNQRYAVADLAINYINQNKSDKASLLLDSLFNVCLEQKNIDTHLLNYIRRSNIDAMIDMGNVEKLDSIDYQLININNSLDNTILKSQLSISRDSYNDILDSISQVSCSNEDKARILYARYKNAKENGDIIRTLELVDSLLFYQGSVTEQIIKESATGAKSDFYSSLAIHKTRESKLLMLLLGLSIMVFAAVVFSIWKIYHMKEIANKAELDSKVEAFVLLKAYSDKLVAERQFMSEIIHNDTLKVERLEATISNMQNNIAQYKEAQLSELQNRSLILESLFRDQWTTLNFLCELYYEKGESARIRNHIIIEIEKELKQLRSQKALYEIEKACNKYMDDIIIHLRSECSFLSENDIIFATLLIAGISTKAICYLIELKTGNFYVKKRRIITRISESDISHKKQILDKLK